MVFLRKIVILASLTLFSLIGHAGTMNPGPEMAGKNMSSWDNKPSGMDSLLYGGWGNSPQFPLSEEALARLGFNLDELFADAGSPDLQKLLMIQEKIFAEYYGKGSDMNPVPVPPALALFASALLGLFAYGRKKA